MVHPARNIDPSIVPYTVVSARLAAGLEREPTRRFNFRVPPRWRSPILENPFAAEAEAAVIAWFESIGCLPAEVARARRFDIAGYVGIPFPSLARDKTIRVAKYLSLWLLWDDVEVETLEGRWRIDAAHVLSGQRPEGMTRFDEGWWQLFTELASEHSAGWITRLCEAMEVWNAAAIEEAEAMKAQRERGDHLSFARQMSLRIATIGMYATVHLLEDAQAAELPPAFHDHATVRWIETLASQIVGLGNDILSLGKDCSEDQSNLITTLMIEEGVSIDGAIERLVRMHDEALEEFDRLADSLSDWPAEASSFIARWLQDLRYASLGFSLWESQAPRYSAHKIVVDGQVIEPKFSFFPPPRSAPPSSRRLPAPPSSRRLGGPQSVPRLIALPRITFPEDP